MHQFFVLDLQSFKHSSIRYIIRIIQRQMNDCDINFPMNQSNECTINNKVEDSCLNVVNSNATTAAVVSTTATTTTDQPPNLYKPKTLILQFSHSTNTCTATVSNDDDIINSPLDIYTKFGMKFSKSIWRCFCVYFHVENLVEIIWKITGSTIESTNNRTILSSSLSADALNKSMLSATPNQSVSKAKLTNDPNALDVPNINQKPSKSILKKRDSGDHEIRASSINERIEGNQRHM